MKLNSMFKKPVDRPIEGVIKADDETSLLLEIEEYVLTNEVSKRLESFLEAYNNYENANGVWISGFFGSGKSHLLKMLAHLLENKDINGTPCLELFSPKCLDNEILKGDIKNAASIPSKSILFNIDQKADVISKTEIDALLAVFVKVFDEMCGFYGKQGHIAQFERDLTKRDVYEGFKSAYKDISGTEWSKGREQALLEAQNIAKAYAKAIGCSTEDADGILDKYRHEYKVSIEDFASQVHDYIESQGKEFRLNFLVDEVGQYIAGNTKLMTNLQTVAESLATKSRGRAWIIVTAQEDMSSVMGEMDQQQGNDFSKIQARFANRMKLTGADVAEVIQKRLLSKNEQGEKLLSGIYEQQSNNFKTLFDFADGAQTYRNFRDKEDFTDCYPFIPYQFPLFQTAIENLSQHSAFEGKHTSVGERSMLGVFQQVAMTIASHKVGQLATFDLMFEGIRTTLKSQIQSAITKAEKHLQNSFALRVLKALFLVKYVKSFNATVRNICVLMLDEFDQDLPKLKRDVEEALDVLEQQTYIQRNGDQFIFLSDEEKDVEEEIKNTKVEVNDVTVELAKIAFDNIIKNKKIRHDEYGQDYPFSRKLDDHLMGREYELSIHVISPFHENSDNINSVRTQSMANSELYVVLQQDKRVMDDLLMYKRTEIYHRQNISTTQQDSIKRILSDKIAQNRERYSEIHSRVETLLCKATLLAKGEELDIGGDDPKVRISKGFLELILRIYPNLRMLRGIQCTENEISKFLEPIDDSLAILTEPEQEILNFIQSNSRGGVRSTIKSLLDKFERSPFGWYNAAVLCNLAKLCARGKVEVRQDSNILEGSELERAIRNSHGHGNVGLDPQVEFTGSQVRQLKGFYQEFFDKPPSGNEAKSLGKATADAFKSLHSKLSPLASQVNQYPFLVALNGPIAEINEFSDKPYTFQLTELSRHHETLLDRKETILDPIQKFMSGSMKDLYDEAKKYLTSQEPNFSYIEGDENDQIQTIITDPLCFKGNRMQQVKTMLGTLKKAVSVQLKIELELAHDKVLLLKNRIEGMDDFKSLKKEMRTEINELFDSFKNELNNQTLIAVVKDTLRRFEEDEYVRLLQKIAAWCQSKATPGTKAKVEYVKCSSISVQFDKPHLANEEDLNRYMEALKAALAKEIKSGKRIQI